MNNALPRLRARANFTGIIRVEVPGVVNCNGSEPVSGRLGGHVPIIAPAGPVGREGLPSTAWRGRVAHCHCCKCWLLLLQGRLRYFKGLYSQTKSETLTQTQNFFIIHKCMNWPSIA